MTDRNLDAIKARWGNVSKSAVRRLLTLDDCDVVRGDILALLEALDARQAPPDVQAQAADEPVNIFSLCTSCHQRLDPNGSGEVVLRHEHEEAIEQLDAQVADMERLNNALRTEMKQLEQARRGGA